MKYLRRGVSYKNIKLQVVSSIKIASCSIILKIILLHYAFYAANFRPLKSK